MRDVGLSLGISEEAAKKRVSRAIDKLRAVLSRGGVALGAAAAAAVLTGKTVQAAPVNLAQTVVKTAIGASGSAALPPLAQETLRAWRWAKIKFIAAAGAVSAVVLLAIIHAAGFFAGRSPNSPAAENPLGGKVRQTTNRSRAAISSSPVVSSNRQTIKKTGAITGIVLDDQDHPVAGALVWGGFSFEPFARDITDQLGQFALDKTGAPNWVTIQADGFAADQQEFDPTNGPRTLVFHLSRVSPLKIRIVDEAGHGLAGINLSLYRWWGTTGTLAQHFPQETDAEGRLQWLSAPKGELEVQFCKLGYRCSRTNQFSADAVEHVIVLHPEADVRGAVVDADTGAAVSAFTYTQGHSQPYVPSDSPMWDLYGKSGSNGYYHITIDEEQRPYLRIEAQGYETLETAIDLTNETQAVRDFRLTPQTAAHSIHGNVFLPDGSPATNVEVALCTDQVGVWLRGTAFDPEAFGNVNRSQRTAYRRKTDAQGAFSFDPKPGAHTLYSVSPAGLGQVRCFDISSPLKIQLQPWGRIEGTVRTRDGNWGGRTVQWHAPGKLTSWMTLYCRPEAFTARSDETGTFVLEHVPPGVCRVSVGGVLSPAIDVSPGETAHVQVGGVGRPVVGKFIAPPDTPIRSWPTQATLAKAYTEADYDMPANLSGSAAERWKLEFQESLGGQTYQRNQRDYDLNVEADGSFVALRGSAGEISAVCYRAAGESGFRSRRFPTSLLRRLANCARGHKFYHARFARRHIDHESRRHQSALHPVGDFHSGAIFLFAPRSISFISFRHCHIFSQSDWLAVAGANLLGSTSI